MQGISSSSTNLILYSFWHSSCSWRVRFALHLKGIPYEYKAVDLLKGEQFSPEFERLNPLHFVPVLVDGNVVVSDSFAILMYLEEKYPQNALLPVDPKCKALNLQASSIVSCSIQPLQMLGVLKYIEEKLGPEERLSWAQHHIEKGFIALEKLLKDSSGKYATGDEVCMADVFLAPQISSAITRFHVDMIEGAVAEDGRKPNIWDSYIHGGNIDGVANADIAADQYHKYKDDVKLMYDMGLDAYRLSFSWSRILPDGRGYINQKGLNYYNNLINELVSYGIEPHVTLSHFDLPQTLQDEYGGLISPKIIEDFTAYADVCFREFGDRVKYWTTFNEPNIQTIGGNDIGTIPPARCSYPFGAVNCTEGDSTTEPYTSAHYILLSHAAAVNLYKEKYQEKQRGRIGITLLVFWMEPMTDSPRDIAATQRSITFHLGWFLDPVVYGNYPALMRKIVGSRLPVFTESESKQLRGSFDFIGLNHYCVMYIQDLPTTPDKYGSDYLLDVSSIWSFSNGKSADFIRVKAPGMPVASWGLQKALEYVKLKYKNPEVMIHENGYANSVSSPAHTNDTARIEYLQAYIESVLLSIRNGSNVRGYFVWSFMDCFEWLMGYTARFGLYGVDFNDKDLKRFPRLSAHWYTSFLAKSGKKTETSTYLYNA